MVEDVIGKICAEEPTIIGELRMPLDEKMIGRRHHEKIDSDMEMILDENIDQRYYEKTHSEIKMILDEIIDQRLHKKIDSEIEMIIRGEMTWTQGSKEE